MAIFQVVIGSLVPSTVAHLAAAGYLFHVLWTAAMLVGLRVVPHKALHVPPVLPCPCC